MTAGDKCNSMRGVGGIIVMLSAVSCAVSQNSVQIIIDDMRLPGDAALHGVPSTYGWHLGNPRVGTVPSRNANGEWMTAMSNWGQVYIPVEGSDAVNTRCQIRNVMTKVLYKNGQWYVKQDGYPQGAAYREDYLNNSSMDAGIRDETGNGGGISVKVGVEQWAGHNFHFWSGGGRARINVDSIIGVFTTCEARLIVDDPRKADDRAICRNVLQMGADWWLNDTVSWRPDWTANFDIGMGRSKWVTTEWQSFNFCTLSDSAIRSNPPVGLIAVLRVCADRSGRTSSPSPAFGTKGTARYSGGSYTISGRRTVSSGPFADGAGVSPFAGSTPMTFGSPPHQTTGLRRF